MLDESGLGVIIVAYISIVLVYSEMRKHSLSAARHPGHRRIYLGAKQSRKAR